MQKQKKKQPFFTVAKEWNLKKYVKKTLRLWHRKYIEERKLKR